VKAELPIEEGDGGGGEGHAAYPAHSLCTLASVPLQRLAKITEWRLSLAYKLRQPVGAALKPLARERVGGHDLPRLVLDLVKLQGLQGLGRSVMEWKREWCGEWAHTRGGKTAVFKPPPCDQLLPFQLNSIPVG
jgi:hypothetical protein